MLRPQVVSHCKAIGKEAVTSFRACLQAMKNLKSWHGVTIGIVSMETQSSIGVGQVVGIGFRPDIKYAAIIRLMDKADELCYFFYLLIFAGNVLQENDPVFRDCP